MRKLNWRAAARMTEGEYRANLDGLNIFFGAVLGFVLAGTETLRPVQFAAMLAITAGMVVGILYVTASRQRLGYAVLAAVMIAFLPRLLRGLFEDGAAIPVHLQPTLAVWLALTLLVEFLPRGPSERARDDEARG